jgi:ATPase subunit of ABC transporter with duplicated ATPase domains
MADEKIIFSMVGVSKTFTNQKKVLNNIYLSFFYGAKIGIIGLNGSGKSTLMKIIAGIDKNFQGEVVFSPGYSVGYLEQEPQLDDTKTVREVVEEGCASTVALLKEYEDINMKLCEPMSDDEMNRLIERQGELYEQIDHVNGWELDSVLERAMDALRCPDADQSVKVLSGGERRRVALCRLLLQQPDVLLLDEPTNHLDAESIDWLEQHLQQYKGTVIAVTHDRYFLDNVAGWILELDRGEGIPWKGNYSGWLDQKTKRLAMEEKQESKRRKTLERELEWVRMSPSGRRAKSKARLSAYDKMLNEDVRTYGDEYKASEYTRFRANLRTNLRTQKNTQRRYHHRHNAYYGCCYHDVNAHECYGYAHSEGVDACGNGHDKHCAKAEVAVVALLFIAEGFAYHVDAD